MTSPSQFPPADSTPAHHAEPGTPTRPAEVIALLDTAATELTAGLTARSNPTPSAKSWSTPTTNSPSRPRSRTTCPVLATRNARRRLAALTTGAPEATDSEGTV